MPIETPSTERNVMVGMKWTNEWLRDAEEPNREFLFLMARRLGA
jgi:adenine-specific DNA-methyltransferase